MAKARTTTHLLSRSYRVACVGLALAVVGGATAGCDGAGAGTPPGTGTAGGTTPGTGGRGTGGRGGNGAGVNAGNAGSTGSAGSIGNGSGGAPVACGAAALGTASHPSEGANHTLVCSAVAYATNPPSSGTHYPTWPAYHTYATPVPWGYLVHGLEHGAVEVVYNCPGGCPAEVNAAQSWIDSLPADTNCGGPPRVILAPDPTLDVRWAATAWMWTLRACTFDAVTFQQFFLAHYDVAPESICGDGADQSSSGWCP